MLDWLPETLQSSDNVRWEVLLFRLIAAFVLGGVVAGIYALTQRRTRTELISFVATLLLLTILIAMVTPIIGNSAARAFSLVGALAIIRFRTVVEDTRDTAFVIFAVVVGMGVGAGAILVPLIGIPIVAAAAFIISRWEVAITAPAGDFVLTVRLGIGRDPQILLRDVFAKHAAHVRLKAATTARQGAALDLTYTIRLRQDDNALAFVADLNQIEGVQTVELRH